MAPSKSSSIDFGGYSCCLRHTWDRCTARPSSTWPTFPQESPSPSPQPCALAAPVGRSPGEAAALKEPVCPPQPAGRGPRLPKVYCIISCIGCFGLFSKVQAERDSLGPVWPVEPPGRPGRLTRLCSLGPQWSSFLTAGVEPRHTWGN